MGRTIRLLASAALGGASLGVVFILPEAASAQSPTGPSTCSYATPNTTCTAGGSLNSTTTNSGTYWNFVVNKIPTNVTISDFVDLYVCWNTYCSYAHSAVLDKNGSWHIWVYENASNTDPSTGAPLPPTSAQATIDTGNTEADFGLYLSDIPGKYYPTTTTGSTSTTTHPTTTTTHPTTTTTHPTTTTTHPTTTTTHPTTTTTAATTTTGSNNQGSNGSTTTSSGPTTTGSNNQASNGSTTTSSGPTTTGSNNQASNGSTSQTTGITVPSTNTGAPWDSLGWRLALATLAMTGAILVFPWKRRRSA